MANDDANHASRLHILSFIFPFEPYAERIPTQRRMSETKMTENKLSFELILVEVTDETRSPRAWHCMP